MSRDRKIMSLQSLPMGNGVMQVETVERRLRLSIKRGERKVLDHET
jgi:hypothetical protein